MTSRITHRLLDRIRDTQARVGVIGLGYVGLPLAVEFARAGFDVTGFDVDAAKIDADQRRAAATFPDVAAGGAARRASKAGTLRATTDMSAARRRWTRSTSASRRRCARPRIPTCRTSCRRSKRWPRRCSRGQLVILESTTYPGTTDEVVQPMLEAGGLKADVDFFLAFSPERVDPGNPQFTTQEHPEDRRRRRPGEHRGGGGAVRRDGRSTSCRSARRASPRW